MCSLAGSIGSAAAAASPSISAAEAAGVSAAEKPRPRSRDNTRMRARAHARILTPHGETITLIGRSRSTCQRPRRVIQGCSSFKCALNKFITPLCVLNSVATSLMAEASASWSVGKLSLLHFSRKRRSFIALQTFMRWM